MEQPDSAPGACRIHPGKPLHKRLWLLGVALGTFILTLAIGNFFIPREKRLTGGMVGHDFLAFYTAGTFVREGRSRDLYDLHKVRAFQHELAQKEDVQVGDSFGPFWNPPFYALVFVPFSMLSFRAALAVWETINILCLAGAVVLLVRMLRGDAVKRCAEAQPTSWFAEASPAHLPLDWRLWGLVPLLICVSMPAIQAFTHGQNTMVSLLLLTAAVTLWRDNRLVLGGVVAGLLFYKPQLGMVLACAMVFVAGRRALPGLAITGVILLLLNLAFLPGTLTEYRHQLPLNLRQFQVENVYLWDRHATLRALWRLFFQGRVAGEMGAAALTCWIATWALVAGALAFAWWKLFSASRAGSIPTANWSYQRDAFIAAVVTAMPLLMPFYFDYDLLLLAVPAVLCARSALIRPGCRSDRRLVGLWVALGLWMMFNSTVARLAHVNMAVVLIACLQVMLTRRAATILRPRQGQSLLPHDFQKALAA